MTLTASVEPEWAMATILFADIRGFTTLAERVSALEAVAYLNAFFDVALPVIERHGGFVHQLLGDGVLALFGAPRLLADHPDRALAAGCEMLDVVDAQLGDRCRIGIGINSGLVLLGTIGSGRHGRLGVVGDPVNVAARVQDATKTIGEALLVTEATRCLLGDDAPALTPVGGLSLKGRAKPVYVHHLTTSGAPRTATDPDPAR